eukprot:CAMPEP_0113312944 /NCGR_PEP_ID=MMETSP0010_2-20120614/9569_1 /TAXON_ID=216773 ORGANISM="Corethron hystrix, Strain 308" /NCGR_SAMPLE_ID=MMETSP0010_2 /ASSEMBLY_ACC=CAM_ASM_000155 /LENGTH=392 /DNA_ID=CAMNT_0000168865 /DNA_START=36 /DNA_END=1214 /DNA_ORIENTATION=+ /assembly_acc=CAM_ASM_000155
MLVSFGLVLAFWSNAACSSGGSIRHPIMKKFDGPIKGSSKAGQRILKHARRLDNIRKLDQEINISYLANYDLKFIGCYSISTWSMGEMGDYQADGEDDFLVRVKQGRVVQFRLCPEDSCEDDLAVGCKEGYGDYAIDLTTFLEAYVEDMANSQEWMCQYYEEKKCNCYNDDDWQDQNSCLYNCFVENDMSYCMNGDGGNNNNGNQNGIELEDYIFCAEFGDNGNGYGDATYIGPTCDEQGGDVYLGIFSDLYCSVPASSKSYSSYSYGSVMPYSVESGTPIISRDCNPFGQPSDDDRYSQYMVKEDFTLVYLSAAKCESQMTTRDVHEGACGYIEGLKHVSEDGIIRTSVRPSFASSIAIALFFTASILLGSYVYYLRNKILSGAKVNLAIQ